MGPVKHVGNGGGVGASNHVNGTRRPEDGHEQDGEDSGNAVDHHLGEKTVVEEEEVASSSRLWEATAEDYWPFTPAFYPFPGVPIRCEAVWRFLIFSIHNLRDTPFILRSHVPIGHQSLADGTVEVLPLLTSVTFSDGPIRAHEPRQVPLISPESSVPVRVVFSDW
jgi:hypothetical protein